MVRIEDLLFSCLEAGPERAVRLEELCREHPDQAERLRAMLGELQALGFLQSPRGAATPDTAVPASIGDCRLEAPIGRGGMGIVFRARQTRLGDRPVAVKLIRPELVADPRAEARFLREAMLASKLEHPCLCPVLDYGRANGMPYLVMPLVEGRTLAWHIANAREQDRHRTGVGTDLGPTTDSSPPPWARTCEMVERLARGLQAAHGAGLVHRDVKPGNVMIRGDGEPVLLDFGLARSQDGAATQLTLSHEQLGTPAYMAPEQIEPRGRGIDARTDVYALGVLLHECLCLRLPHDGATRDELARRILDEPASDVRRHGADVPRELAVVLQVALEKRPADRYASAQAFADDLRRVRLRQPILARRPAAAVRAVRWVERNPWPTAAGAVLALGLAASLVLLAKVRDQARVDRALALVGRSQALASVDESLALAFAEAGMAAAPELHATSDQLHRAARGMHELAIHDGFVGGVVLTGFSRDGTRTFAVGRDGTLLHTDRDGRDGVRLALGVAVEQAMTAEGPTGLHVVLACADGTVRLWTPGRDGAPPTIGPKFAPQPGKLIFGERGAVAADGSRVLLGANDAGPGAGRVVVLSLPDGRELRRLELTQDGKPWTYACGAFAGADGLVVGGSAGRVQFWRGDQTPTHTFRHPAGELGPGAAVTRLAVGKDQAIAMVAGMPALLRCDLKDGSSTILDRQRLGLCELAGAPDGDVFATGANDGTIALWRFGDDETGPRRLLFGHTASVRILGFAADGARLLSGGDDHTVRIWDRRGDEVLRLPGHRSTVTAVAVDAAATRVQSGGLDTAARLWRTTDGLPVAVHPLRAPQSLARFCLDRDPHIVWVGDVVTGALWRIDWTTGAMRAFEDDRDTTFRQLDLGAQGTLACIGRGNAVELRATADGQRLARFDRFDAAPAKAILPEVVGSDLTEDGTRAVVVLEGGAQAKPQLLVLDVHDGALALRSRKRLEDTWDRFQPYLNRADLGPDEHTVVVCRADGTLRLYDLDANPVSPALPHSTVAGEYPYRGTLSRDGTLLLSAGTDGRVVLWRRQADGRWTDRTLTTFSSLVRSAYFDANERRVVAGGDDGVLRVLDLDGNVLHLFERRESAFLCVRFAADDRHVLATMLDGRLLSWMLDGHELQDAAARLRIRALSPAERDADRELLGDR